MRLNACRHRWRTYRRIPLPGTSPRSCGTTPRSVPRPLASLASLWARGSASRGTAPSWRRPMCARTPAQRVRVAATRPFAVAARPHGRASPTPQQWCRHARSVPSPRSASVRRLFSASLPAAYRRRQRWAGPGRVGSRPFAAGATPPDRSGRAGVAERTSSGPCACARAATPLCRAAALPAFAATRPRAHHRRPAVVKGALRWLPVGRGGGRANPGHVDRCCHDVGVPARTWAPGAPFIDGPPRATCAAGVIVSAATFRCRCGMWGAPRCGVATRLAGPRLLETMDDGLGRGTMARLEGGGDGRHCAAP